MDSSLTAQTRKKKRLSEDVGIPEIAANPNPASSPNSGGVRNESGEIRLCKVKDVIDYDCDRDFDFLKELYKKWVAEDEYLVLHEEEILPNQTSGKGKWFAVKCSKRGNDVYQSRINERLEEVFKVLEPEMKGGAVQEGEVKGRKRKGQKARGIRKTNALCLSLSYDTKLKSRGKAWEDIGIEWNRFLSRLKKKFGKFGQIRSWESFENGYPHIHTLVIFEKREFAIWQQKKKKKDKKGNWYVEKKWRVKNSTNEAIGKMWHSFVDVQGVVDLKDGLEYIAKYIQKDKQNAYKYIDEWGKKELLTAVSCWFFKKKSFSISGKFIDLIKAICVTQTKREVQITLYGEKPSRKYELKGIIARTETEIDSYTWSKSYKKAPKWIDEVRKIKNHSDNRMQHDDFFK